MTIELTWKRRQFLERMLESAENAEWGFEALLKRQDFAAFFEHLRDFGLFDPKNSPAPIPIENGEYVRVPYWSALDYLEACAKLSGQLNDVELVAFAAFSSVCACRLAASRRDLACRARPRT